MPQPETCSAFTALVLADPATWVRSSLPAEIGDCAAERLELEPGLAVVRSRYLPRHDWVERHANAAGPRTLVLTFGLEGASSYREQRGGQLRFEAGHVTVAAFQGSQGERRFRAGACVSQLRLLVQEPVLARFLDESVRARLLPCGGGLSSLAHGRTGAGSAAHALALFRARRAGGLSTLDCQIHALSLLAEQLRGLGADFGAVADGPPVRDRDRLAQARALMTAQLARPLTLAYLSAAVGMSEARFKAGFRAVFGTSPGRLLLQLRMERAHVLLEGGCQVAQAAWQVGYAHPCNFSTAFTRYYGRPPKSVAGESTATS